VERRLVSAFVSVLLAAAGCGNNDTGSNGDSVLGGMTGGGMGGTPLAGMIASGGMGGAAGVGTTGGVGATGGGGAAGGGAIGGVGAAGGGAVGGMPPTGGMDATGGMPGTGGTAPMPMGEWEDPGSGPWELVPEDQVAAVCKMDINLLKSSGITHNHAVFRYGKLCYESGSDRATDVFSVTKTVSGTVVGAAAYDTRNNAKKFLPSDLVSEWGVSGSADLRISHLASMVANSASLDWGRKTFAYDTFGTNLARTGTAVSNAIEMGTESGATSLTQIKDSLFEKLGLEGGWSMGSYGTGAQLTLHDMGKIFTLLIHGGWYGGEQLVGEDWVYWMTHPAWEDANTSYGMYTWLNHRGNATGIGGDFSTSGQGDPEGDACAPAAFWDRYPHPPSEATDCMATTGAGACEQMYDVGVFSAQGLGGQFIIGHRGLDLVLAVKDYSNQGGPAGMWAKIRPALVALDPMFMGDEAAFCEAYGAGNYAPDLKKPLPQPPDP